MKHLKILGVAMVAVCAFGITMATSAFALPVVSLTLAGSTFPLTAEANLTTVKTKLTSSSGESLKGEGLLLLLTTTASGSSGTFSSKFTHVTNTEGTECHSTGDAAGSVLTKGTFDVVYTSLSTLTLGTLYLVSPLEVVCGTEEISVKGDILSSLNAGTEATELTEESGLLTGNGKGKPRLTNYYNSAGTGVKPQLLGNVGTGFVENDEEVAEEVKVKANKTNMFVITGR